MSKSGDLLQVTHWSLQMHTMGRERLDTSPFFLPAHVQHKGRMSKLCTHTHTHTHTLTHHTHSHTHIHPAHTHTPTHTHTHSHTHIHPAHRPEETKSIHNH